MVKRGENIVRLTVYLPRDTYRKLKYRTFDEGRTVTSVVRGLIEWYLASPPEAAKKMKARNK